MVRGSAWTMNLRLDIGISIAGGGNANLATKANLFARCSWAVQLTAAVHKTDRVYG